MYHLLIVQGTWNWVDQTPFEYNNWQEGEPNHLDDFKYCAKIYETGVGEEMLGKWDDTLCDEPHSFICEKPRCKDFIFPHYAQNLFILIFHVNIFICMPNCLLNPI